MFERLKREIEQQVPSEQLTIGGMSEQNTAADPKLPRPKQRMPPLFIEPVRRRVRRVGVVATRDPRTGDIRLRNYSLDT